MMGSHPNTPVINWKYYSVKMNLMQHPIKPHCLAARDALGYYVFTPRIMWLVGSCGLLLLLASLVRQCHVA